MNSRKIFIILVAALAALGTAPPSEAALNAVDPGPYEAAYGFYAKWYQDTFGRALELCLSPAVIAPDPARGINGGAACTLLANPGIFDPAQPMVFPTNFPDESFWFMSAATIVQGGVDLSYSADLEAAFGGGDPAPNDQVSFARIRIRIDLPATAPGGAYTVIHPYGVEVYEVEAGGGTRVINMTRDIGIGAPGDYTGALKGDIGPFLVDETVPTLGPIVVGTELFIGDPNTPRPVVGSPFGTNFVRLEGPDGFTPFETNLFTVMGKLYTAEAIPLPLTIERTSYSRTADGDQTDVFAKAPPNELVSFLDTTGVFTPMSSDVFGQFFGQSTALAPPPWPPIPVTVGTPPDPISVTKSSELVDLVVISRADFSSDGINRTLVVEAASSDEVNPPVLTVNGQPMTLVGAGPLQTLTLTGLTIPPAKITVLSAAGGSDTEEVDVLP